MAARHAFEGELATCYLADVVGVRFAGEDEAAVFLPYAGEVLLCAASAWLEVSESRLPVLPAVELAPSHEVLSPTISGQNELRVALTRLGAQID